MGHNSDLGAAIRFMYSSIEPFPLSGNDANFESVESEVQMEVEEFGSTLEIETVSFHNSWDWLMPVVEKCYSTNLYYRYKDESCRQFFEGGIELTTNIDDVWLACVEFVKWLNEQQ